MAVDGLKELHIDRYAACYLPQESVLFVHMEVLPPSLFQR